jgi:hypothetical protein
MKYNDFAIEVAKELGISQHKSKKTVKKIFEMLFNSIKESSTRIPGFGTFKIEYWEGYLPNSDGVKYTSKKLKLIQSSSVKKQLNGK